MWLLLSVAIALGETKTLQFMHSTSIMIADGLHLLLNFPDLGCAAADAPENILKSIMKIKKVNNFLIL